jgi:hypothetical protein
VRAVSGRTNEDQSEMRELKEKEVFRILCLNGKICTKVVDNVKQKQFNLSIQKKFGPVLCQFNYLKSINRHRFARI